MAKVMRKVVEIDEELCDGCGLCVPACHEGAIKIVNGKAKVINHLCDGLGDCIGHCPKGAIRIVEKEVEETAFCCPGSALRDMEKEASTVDVEIPSALTHWPVQVRLVPPHAPFLRGADLLIVADCVPVAYPELHTKLMPGKKVLVGCPKFDPAAEYVERFASIFEMARPKSVTVAIMEVPCCGGLVREVLTARDKAGVDVPVKVVVVGVNGSILREEEL